MKRLYRNNPLLVIGSILLAVLILLSVLVPALSPYSYAAQNGDLQNAGVSFVHPFGTDKFGRDLFVRVFYGTRISLLVGAGSALVCGLTGTAAGSAAGYAGGRVDMLLMRAADVMDSIPSLLYVILIMLALGPHVGSVILGICIGGWTGLARIVRGQVMHLKTRDYCIAARMAGAGTWRILRRHLLPNGAGPVIVNVTFLIPKAIFTEAFLSFAGVGIGAPVASLGTLIQDARSQMQIYPSQMLYPIAVLCILIVSVNLIGAGLERAVRREKEV